MKFKLLLILSFILGSTTQHLYSLEQENIAEITQESLNKDYVIEKCKEQPDSQLTKIIDTCVRWNQKYIIPLSYAYIIFDISKNFYGAIKQHLYCFNSEKIYPNYSGDNQLYQKIVSMTIQIGQKMGAMPRSIIITKNLGPASDFRDIIIPETLFEDESENEVIYTIAHELSHIKRYHAMVGSIVGGLLWWGGCKQADNVFDTSYERSNIKKICKMIYTSPLLYYFCAQLIWYAVSRYCEKDADLTAAAAVGAEGGIDFFGRFLNGHKTGLFDSHPSNQERFDYLQAFKNMNS